MNLLVEDRPDISYLNSYVRSHICGACVLSSEIWNRIKGGCGPYNKKLIKHQSLHYPLNHTGILTQRVIKLQAELSLFPI